MNTRSCLSSQVGKGKAYPLVFLAGVLIMGACWLLANSSFRQSTIEEVEKLALECTNGQAKSCEKLAAIALNDEQWQVRMAAARRIVDQTVLRNIATSDENARVRETAVKNIVNQKLLREIVEDDKSLAVKELAIAGIKDQDVLAAIAQNGDLLESARIIAVRKIVGQAVLRDLAKNDGSWRVRKVVVEKIDDQKILVEIAKRDEDYRVRAEATERLDDQSMLLDIAKTDPVRPVRIAAAKKITNQKALAEIARTEISWAVARVAFEKVNDMAVLIDIAKNAVSDPARKAAVEKIDDQKVLLGIANSDGSKMVRDAAIQKLPDQSLSQVLAHKGTEAGQEKTGPTAKGSGSADNRSALKIISSVRMDRVTFQTGSAILQPMTREGQWLVVTVLVTPPHDDFKVIPSLRSKQADSPIQPSGIGGAQGKDSVFLEYEEGPGVARIYLKGSPNWIALNDNKTGNYMGAGFINGQGDLLMILNKDRLLQFMKAAPLKVTLAFRVADVPGPYQLDFGFARAELKRP